MRRIMMLGVAASLMVAGCGSPTEEQGASETVAETAVVSATTPASPCADDGPRLALTGLCEGRAINYLNMDTSASPEPAEGCEWKVMETQFVDDVLLYRGLQCGARETKLEFAGGAHRAELLLTDSAYGPIAEPSAMVSVYVIEGDALTGVTQRALEGIETKAEAEGCAAKFAKQEFWPSDAIVVDIPAAKVTTDAADGPRTACGPLGLDEDSSAFWRVAQGFGYFFNLGQDAFEIDPGSFTMMTKAADGGWKALKVVGIKFSVPGIDVL